MDSARQISKAKPVICLVKRRIKKNCAHFPASESWLYGPCFWFTCTHEDNTDRAPVTPKQVAPKEKRRVAVANLTESTATRREARQEQLKVNLDRMPKATRFATIPASPCQTWQLQSQSAWTVAELVERCGE